MTYGGLHLMLNMRSEYNRTQKMQLTLVAAQALLHTWNATLIVISPFVHIKSTRLAAEAGHVPAAIQEIRCKGHRL